jgi:hypothetical protein
MSQSWFSSEFADVYGGAIRKCVVWQVVLGVLAGLMLDQAQSAWAFGVALLCHWAVILIILHRRPAQADPHRPLDHPRWYASDTDTDHGDWALVPSPHWHAAISDYVIGKARVEIGSLSARLPPLTPSPGPLD